MLLELLPPDDRISCDRYCWLFLLAPPLWPLSSLLESPAGLVYTRSQELNVLLSFVFLLGSSILLSTSIMGSRVSFEVEIFWHVLMGCVLAAVDFWVFRCSSAVNMIAIPFSGFYYSSVCLTSCFFFYAFLFWSVPIHHRPYFIWNPNFSEIILHNMICRFHKNA